MAMKSKHKYRGFSLTEVLLAVGTLAIGMIFIAGVFPVAIHSTTIATERTVAAVVADEAFAKIRLYGGADPNWLSTLSSSDCNDFSDLVLLNPNEFAYPSTDPGIMQKQYYWSALCRRVDGSNIQVTVFVSRKVGASTRYWDRNPVTGNLILIATVPVPVRVNVLTTGNPYELSIDDIDPEPTIYEETFINDGYTIVDNETGDIYRVLERYRDNNTIILLDRPWDPGIDKVWVVPPPIGGGRYPCIAIYQRVIRF